MYTLGTISLNELLVITKLKKRQFYEQKTDNKTGEKGSETPNSSWGCHHKAVYYIRDSVID